MSARKLARLALLTGVALSLFVVELQLPDLFPIPGAKLGLANIVTVYALYRCRAGEAAMVLAARILLGGLLGGRGIAIVYSAAGGAACFAGKTPMRLRATLRAICADSRITSPSLPVSLKSPLPSSTSASMGITSPPTLVHARPLTRPTRVFPDSFFGR